MATNIKNNFLRSNIITMKKDLLEIKKNGFGFTKNFQTQSPAPAPAKPLEPVIKSAPAPTPSAKPLAPEPTPTPIVKSQKPEPYIQPAPAPVAPAPEPTEVPKPAPMVKSQKPEPYYTKPAPILRPAPVQGLKPEAKLEPKKESLGITPSANPNSLPKPPQAVFSSFGSELMVKEPAVVAPQNTVPTFTPSPAPAIKPISPEIKPEIKPTKSFMEEVEDLINADKK